MFESDPPRTVPALKERIANEIEAIPVNMLQEVMENFYVRLQECHATNGTHLKGVILKK